jgi:hypothetical protein
MKKVEIFLGAENGNREFEFNENEIFVEQQEDGEKLEVVFATDGSKLFWNDGQNEWQVMKL